MDRKNDFFTIQKLGISSFIIITSKLKIFFTEDHNVKKKLLIGSAFIFYLFIATYKLLHASLWFDETIEYYVSKYMFGPLPVKFHLWVNTTNMYERIIKTFQPPLYNLIMFFWLQIIDTEWWFRFAGVVMGFIGAVGILFSIQKTINYKWAAIAVIIYSCTYMNIYYIQECAEYNLMMGLLCWTLFFFIRSLQQSSFKNILLFGFFSVLSVYSQYGAAFPVIAFSIVIFVKSILERNIRTIIQNIFVYITIAILAALPLVVFFLIPQIKHQLFKIGSGPFVLTFDRYFFINFGNAILQVFKWNFHASNDVLSMIFLSVFLLICLYSIVRSKNKNLLYLLLANAMTLIFYYIAVYFKIYGYGDFGNRYNVFFIPLWLVSIIIILSNFINCIEKEKIQILQDMGFLFRLILVLFAFIYCLNGWSSIKNNWVKENSRGVVNAWYNNHAYNSITLVYYAASTGFNYYVERDNRYHKNFMNNIYFQDSYRKRSVEFYTKYFDNLFNEKMPKDIYLCATHIQKDFKTMLTVFRVKGYTVETIFENKGCLLHLYIP